MSQAAAMRALPEGLELSELDETFRENPHARLDLLREHAPRYLDPASQTGRLILTRHEDCRAALFDRTLTRDVRKDPAARKRDALDVGSLLSMEGPEHRALRKLVGGALDARTVEGRRTRVTAIIDDLLDPIAAKGRFDGIADFAAPLPLLVIAEVLGLPPADLSTFRAWSEDLGVLTFLPARTEAETARVAAAIAGLKDYVQSAIVHRRAAPGDDLISDLLAADVEGRRLGEPEIIPLCLLLIAAGAVTLSDLIGNGISLLLDHPHARAALRADPDAIEGVVEEVLRFEPPISAASRHTPEAREVLGCPVGAGATVKALLVAANRDPEVFEDPHSFRIDRSRRDHVAFGGGAHTCPGGALARFEGRLALGMLFARFPDLRRDGHAERKVCYGFRGFETLPLATT